MNYIFGLGLMSRSEMLCKKALLKNFAILLGKHLGEIFFKVKLEHQKILPHNL